MSGDFFETKRHYELQDAAADVIVAAEKVHRRLSSHRNAKCVMELKRAVEKLHELRARPL